MHGGGGYQKETMELLRKLKASGVILIVAGGTKGDGFEVAMNPDLVRDIPSALREVAAKMERDIQFLTTEQPQG